MTRREVFEAALALPDAERAELLEQLQASFDVELEPALLAIIREREAAFDRGEPGVDGKLAFERLRTRG